MDLLVAALCDSASEYDGKLCLLGAFDTIYVSGLPAVHPQCSVALRLVFGPEEDGPNRVRVGFLDENGAPLTPPLEAVINVAFPPKGHFASRNLVLNLQHLRFEKEGLYAIEVAVGTRRLARIPLHVRLIPAPPAS